MQARPSAAPRWAREIAGVGVAIALAIIVVGSVAASDRSELLLRDGDSLLTTLFARSLEVGQAQDWAMSTVLFLPELAVFCVLWQLGAGVGTTLALSGIVNLVALYGAFRVAAGSHARARAPIAGALLGSVAFSLLAVLDTSASRDALELASLQTTTTYYAATVVGCALVVGLVRRALESAGWGAVVGVAVVGAASVLSNPLFAAWATVPLVIAVIVIARDRRAWIVVGALVGGATLGALGRVPLAQFIANTGAGYADPSQWLASLDYYALLFGERASSLPGVAALVLTALLLAAGVVLTVRVTERGPRLVAMYSWVAPLLVLIGAVALGTHAARYLQPLAFAAALSLVVSPERVRIAVPRLAPVVAAGLLVVAAVAGIPRIAHAVSRPDADLDCVTSWVDASHRTGAGQFWTIRLPKAHVADPRSLVQVDHRLHGYAWLVNRDDFAIGEVTFLVVDDQSYAFDLPDGITIADARVVSCGRYSILDFGDLTVPLGPQRS